MHTNLTVDPLLHHKNTYKAARGVGNYVISITVFN